MPDEAEIQEKAKERVSPSSSIVHEAILSEGLEELERPSSALFWSALAAGLSMGLSMIAEGVLRSYLPAETWRPLIVKFGYSVGFLVVILGRQQLYTENTLTAVLPFLEEKSWHRLLNLGRLWVVVLVGNLIGAALVALFCTLTNAFDPPVRAAFLDLGREALRPTGWTVVLRGIAAGWMIALIVWLLPFAEAARFSVILLIAYLVGLAGLSHVVAGAVEVFGFAAGGGGSWWGVLASYVLPALLGNTIGGVTLVAALNHAQVRAGRK